MKNKILAAFLSFAAVSTILFFALINSNSSASYSAIDDPLLTLSYVNEVLVPKLEESITQKVVASINNQPLAPNDSASKYTVLALKNGQKLMAKGTGADSLELILRAGSASVISPFTDQGIGDITAGRELQNGEELTKNNYCVIPRGNDGRGILVTSNEIYILVRGEYEILE